MLRTCTWRTLLVFALAPAVAMAQRADQPGAAPPSPAAEREARGFAPGAAAQPEQQLVRYLAGRLILANHAEVKLGELAAERAEDEAVKKFAQKMVKEHGELNERLAELAPEVARTVRERPDEPRRKKPARPGEPRPGQPGPGEPRPGQPRPGQAIPEQPLPDATQPGPTQPGAARPDEIRPGQTQRADRPPVTTADETRPVRPGGAAAAPGLPRRLAQIDRRAAENAWEMTKETLEQYEGHAFDRAYVGQQIAQHILMVAYLGAVRDVGPPEFQQLVQKAEQGAREHLEHAKKLSDQLQEKAR